MLSTDTRKQMLINGGKIIKAVRSHSRYTQVELERATGFSVSTIRKWEAGITEPRFNAVMVVLLTLHYTLDEALELLKDAA